MAISCAPLVTKRIWNCQAFRQEDQSRAGNSIHHAAILEAPFPWTCTSQCNLETAAECNGPRMCPSARCEVGGWWLSPGSIGSTGAALVAPYSFLKFPKDPKVLPCSNFEVFVKLFSAIPPSAQFPEPWHLEEDSTWRSARESVSLEICHSSILRWSAGHASGANESLTFFLLRGIYWLRLQVKA